MRIAIDGPGDVLRLALGDLIQAAGHDLVARDADLRIRVGPSGGEGDATPTLWLSPAGGMSIDSDRAAALERILATGGVAAWDELDPAALLDVLGRPGSPRGSRAGAAPCPLHASPEPWLGVDAQHRRLVWANATARAAIGLTGAGALPPGSDGLYAALTRPKGRGTVEVARQPWSAEWWTDSSGVRILKLSAPRTADPASAVPRNLAALEQMSATLAHELRNPVAAFAGALDMLSRDLIPSERREIVALARGRLDQMRLLLDDTLRLARPFKGAPSPVECALVVRSAVAGVMTDPLFAGVDVRISIDDESMRVLGYEQALRQVVTNLLVNAAQAQEGKGAVEVSVHREGPQAVLQVCDEGPGIPPDLREKVFEPFWTTKKSGTGLGLAYVRRVAEASGGSVRVEEAPGRGACLALRLAVAPAP